MKISEQFVIGLASFTLFISFFPYAGGNNAFISCLFGVLFGAAVSLALNGILRSIYCRKLELTYDQLTSRNISLIRSEYLDAIAEEKKVRKFQQDVDRFDVSQISDLLTAIKKDLNDKMDMRLEMQIQPADTKSEHTFETAIWLNSVIASGEGIRIGHEYRDDVETLFHTVYQCSFSELGFGEIDSEVEQAVLENTITVHLRNKFMRDNPNAMVSGGKNYISVRMEKKIPNPIYITDR